MSDVIIMMTLGGAMYFAMRFGFGPAPLVLGIILGPIAETNFLQGEMIAQAMGGTFTYFFTGGVNLLLIGLCVLSVGYSVFAESNARARRRSHQTGRTVEVQA